MGEFIMRKLIALIAVILGVTFSAQAADVDALIKQLKDSSSDVRRSAAKSLGELGAEAKPAIPALIKALKDQDLFVRRFAAQSLGALGPDAKAAVKDLAVALKDPKKEVAEAAAQALGKMGTDGVAPLADLLKDYKKEAPARKAAADALGTMGKEAPKSAVTALAKVLTDPEVILTPVQPLGKIL